MQAVLLSAVEGRLTGSPASIQEEVFAPIVRAPRQRRRRWWDSLSGVFPLVAPIGHLGFGVGAPLAQRDAGLRDHDGRVACLNKGHRLSELVPGTFTCLREAGRCPQTGGGDGWRQRLAKRHAHGGL